MVTDLELKILEDFLLADGKKSVLEHLNSACSKGGDMRARIAAPILKHIHENKNAPNRHQILIRSAGLGHAEVMRILISAGVQINYTDEDGCSALIVAAFEGHVAIVGKLLELGADIEHSETQGWTALMAAVSEANIAVVEKLLAAGADIEARCRSGGTALMFAAYGEDENHSQIARLLLQKGANIDTKDNSGITAFEIAVQKNNQDSQGLLLSYGANPFSRFYHQELGARVYPNHHANNPLGGYTEKILNCIALSDHVVTFCQASIGDTAEITNLKKSMLVRRCRLHILQSIYNHELEYYQTMRRLNSTARSVHPVYREINIAADTPGESSGSKQQKKQRRLDGSNIRHADALNIVAQNLFSPVAMGNDDHTPMSMNNGDKRAMFFNGESVRKRIEQKYQKELAAKQLPQAQKGIGLPIEESDPVLQRIDASLQQTAIRATVATRRGSSQWSCCVQ